MTVSPDPVAAALGIVAVVGDVFGINRAAACASYRL